MNFPQFLKNMGYEPYRYVYNKHIKSWKYVPCKDDDFFSSMVSGGLDVRYIKDDVEFIWGLHEKGKPPVLISPRPNTKPIKFVDDDLMFNILSSFPFDEIYESCLRRKKIEL